MSETATEPGPPGFPVDDAHERRRFFHHIEWSPPYDGWQYKSTSAKEADHPHGWDPSAPVGWERNVDRWPLVDEEWRGVTRVGPGVLRYPEALGGPVLRAYWRRNVRRPVRNTGHREERTDT